MRIACGTWEDIGDTRASLCRLRWERQQAVRLRHSHMEDKHKLLTPDDDYREAQGCGCVISIALVIVIFAIAAGLWLFTK